MADAVIAPPPQVSVVVPTHDRCTLVQACLESVLAQVGVTFEALVVDDGSTDGTAEHLRVQHAGDDRVRVLAKPNGGAASARNRGLDEARGDVVVLLDSDDLLLPGALAARAAYFEAHPEVDLALCDLRYVGGWKRDGSTLFERPHFRPPTSIEAVLDGAWGQASQMALRRDTAGRVRFDESYLLVEDVEFLCRVLLAGHRVAIDRRPLVEYRHHGDQATGDDRGILEGRLRVLEQYAAHGSGSRRQRVELARGRAKLLAREGQLREARPYLRQWLRWRPSRKALSWYMASYLRR